MKTKFFLITVFSDFANNIRGNVSAVAKLNSVIDEDQMQIIASDLNQPATTFIWKTKGKNSYNIRWFAPDAEISLCGHGSLAATTYLSKTNEQGNISLVYKKGIIIGKSEGKGLCSIELEAISDIKELVVPQVLKDRLGIEIKGYFSTGGKFIVLAESEAAVKDMKPNFSILKTSKVFSYAVTAKGKEVDFVSRTLVPHVQQMEDPATGSSHAALTPFWAIRLQKNKMKALQLSKRGGSFTCELDGNKVKLFGKYEILAEGKIL